ncbi:MAG: chorismate-binding protein, partial [Nocardioides sp.]
MTDPVQRFVAMAAEHERCFWLDGGGSRPWSGRRSLLGWLDEDDVSLTYDAARGEVVRHRGGHREVVGDDVFAALEAESAGDGPEVHWVGYLGYASRPDLPALRDPADPMPTAVWMRTTHVDVIEHDERVEEPVTTTHAGGVEVPEDYAAAFADVQEHLRAGNSYEVNLTHRLTVHSDLDPVAAYLRLRDLNPAPYAGFLQHRGRWLLSSSPERYATIDRQRRIETKPIKGTTPRGETPVEDARLRELLATDPKFR